MKTRYNPQVPDETRQQKMFLVFVMAIMTDDANYISIRMVYVARFYLTRKHKWLQSVYD